MSNKPISVPANYAPAFAVGFSDSVGELALVDGNRPLPVSISGGTTLTVQTANAAGPQPLTGTASTSTLVGPLRATLNRNIVLTLSGTWQGQVQVRRSVDGGATHYPLTMVGQAWGLYTGNACEVIWCEEEAGVDFFVDISLTSGAVTYRLAQ